MTADPPFEVGTTHVRRTWPDRFVGAAVSERGADGTPWGAAVATLLDGPGPASLTACTRKS